MEIGLYGVLPGFRSFPWYFPKVLRMCRSSARLGVLPLHRAHLCLEAPFFAILFRVVLFPLLMALALWRRRVVSEELAKRCAVGTAVPGVVVSLFVDVFLDTVSNETVDSGQILGIEVFEGFRSCWTGGPRCVWADGGGVGVHFEFLLRWYSILRCCRASNSGLGFCFRCLATLRDGSGSGLLIWDLTWRSSPCVECFFTPAKKCSKEGGECLENEFGDHSFVLTGTKIRSGDQSRVQGVLVRIIGGCSTVFLLNETHEVPVCLTGEGERPDWFLVGEVNK